MIEPRLRPCIVGEKRALFHRWIDKQTPIIKIQARLSKDGMRRFEELVKDEYPFIPYCADVMAQKETLALDRVHDVRGE